MILGQGGRIRVDKVKLRFAWPFICKLLTAGRVAMTRYRVVDME